MLPPPDQLHVAPTPAFPVRPSASKARWMSSGAETSSASASLRTAAEVQDQWRSALAASIGGDAVSQQDSSLRELLQVSSYACAASTACVCSYRHRQVAGLRSSDLSPIRLACKNADGRADVKQPLHMVSCVQAALRTRAGRPQGILPDQLASGLMAFYSTQLQPSEHRAFFELLTSAFGVQRALTCPVLVAHTF